MSAPQQPVIESQDRHGIRFVHVVTRRLGWTIDPRQLKDALMQAVDGATRAAVDFSEVTYLCSATIGTVLSFHRDATAAGCRLVLYRMQPYVRDTFVALGLIGLLPIVDTEEQVVEALAD